MLCWTLKILTKMVPLSVMGCPVINSFSLSRNAVTVRFSWSRCETEFWGYLSGISSWKRKGREAGMNRKRKQTAMWVQQSLGQLGGGGGSGVTVASHRGPGSGRNGWVLPALLSDVTRWQLPRKCTPLGEAGLQLLSERSVLWPLFTARQPDLPWKEDPGNSSPGLSESTICTFEVCFPCMFQGWLCQNCSGPLFLRDNLGEGSCWGSGWGRNCSPCPCSWSWGCSYPQPLPPSCPF